MNTLNIGGVPEHFNLPWHLAKENNDFKTNGIDLNWKDMHGGTGEMIEALRSNELDACVLLTEGITKAIAEGLPAKIVHIYVKSPLRWGIHVPTNSSISKFDDLKGKPFAISRFGSGSHLMSFVKANQNNWDLEKELTFNVVNSLEGGLQSLEKLESFAFLWEKFTTHPYVEQGRCRYIDEVVTPWPCFSIAVTDSFLEKNSNAIKTVIQIVSQTAHQLKNNEGNIALISKRYNINPKEIAQWLSEIDWSYQPNIDKAPFETVLDYLIKLNLVKKTKAEALDLLFSEEFEMNA